MPPSERADLAFKLLQNLDLPGEEVIAQQFGAELRDRVQAYRRGEIASSSLEETRAIVQEHISNGQAQ